MIAGEAPHLETFFLSHRFGRPKDQDSVTEKPPILFISAYDPPGSYDPLAKGQEPAVKSNVVAHQRALPLGAPAVLPRGAISVTGHGGADPDPGDEGEEELVVVR
jgi:hypothetical protein